MASFRKGQFNRSDKVVFVTLSIICGKVLEGKVRERKEEQGEVTVLLVPHASSAVRPLSEGSNNFRRSQNHRKSDTQEFDFGCIFEDFF